MLQMITDPVCGMRIDEADAAGHARFESHTFHFCSELCKARFDTDPERYAVGNGSADVRP